MLQERYLKTYDKMQSYIEEESKLFPTTKRISYQTGFIIYNNLHDKIKVIQDTWMEHIRRVGDLQCQIAFFFVSQRFPSAIEEFKEQWSYGRKTVFTA